MQSVLPPPHPSTRLPAFQAAAAMRACDSAAVCAANSSSQQEARLSPPPMIILQLRRLSFPHSYFLFFFPFFSPSLNAKQLTHRSVRGLCALAPTRTCLLPPQNVAGFISTYSVLAGVSPCLCGRHVQPSGVIHADRLFFLMAAICARPVCVCVL